MPDQVDFLVAGSMVLILAASLRPGWLQTYRVPIILLFASYAFLSIAGHAHDMQQTFVVDIADYIGFAVAAAGLVAFVYRSERERRRRRTG